LPVEAEPEYVIALRPSAPMAFAAAPIAVLASCAAVAVESKVTSDTATARFLNISLPIGCATIMRRGAR
jgi:hypothetical protein